jgi:signal transduction histidine kinase
VPRLFDPFFRGRKAVRNQVHGTGLGLNLVRTIVEAHGGSIRVKSGPSRGAAFTIRIPAALSFPQGPGGPGGFQE